MEYNGVKVNKYVAILMILLTLPLYSQISSFTDDFEDGRVDTVWNGTNITLWKADHPRTFRISEQNGVMKIEYTRTSESDEWDNFNFTPPENIDVANNPEITLKIKSDVQFEFQMKPIYSNGNDNYTDVGTVPGNGNWTTYKLDLNKVNYSGSYLTKIYLYFDGGTTSHRSGTVYFDDFKIAVFSINIENLRADLVSGSLVKLSWTSEYENLVDYFNIYRDTVGNFPVDSATFLTRASEQEYIDQGLSSNNWYYKVAAVDTNGKEHIPSPEINIRTYETGTIPEVEISATNSNQVGKYEKFEVKLDLSHASYANPYDPEQVKLYADFISPGNDTTRINGFYDNYNNANEWKIRFAPNQLGEWKYKVYVEDIDGIGASQEHIFSVGSSEHHGWIQISPQNKNYLIHDDGTSFYGIAIYYPWNVRKERLYEFADNGGNMIGYWNSTYDNAGNGGGAYLLESMESGLGRYDQRKAARIDEILEWCEARDIKLMLAINAHDWFCDNDPSGWPSEWDNNPYNEIIEAENFYGDSTVWEYQQKKYRYMLARWGYSRSLAIWEIMNELHGTTGFVHHKEEAKNWTRRVHNYFHANDPCSRPTTVSFGGVREFNQENQYVDMPNRHYYENWGYSRPYNDDVRDGLYNVHNTTRQLKSKGERPAIFGEAGANSLFSPVESEDYTLEFHNAMWAGLTNGLAATPFWWDYTEGSGYITEDRLKHYNYISKFVKDINFAYLDSLKYSEITIDNTDAYLMESDTTGFAWIRKYIEKSISGELMCLNGFSTGTYQLDWYNTYSGNQIDRDTTISVESIMPGVVTNSVQEEDIAIKINPIDNGESASRVNLFLERNKITYFGGFRGLEKLDSIDYNLICYVTDEEKRLVPTFNGQINFSLDGPGRLSAYSAIAHQGGTVIDYFPSDSVGGNITIGAEIAGIGTATLKTEVTSEIQTQTKTHLTNSYILEDNYPNPFNPTTTFEYFIPQNAYIKLIIYNLQGEQVETLVNEQQLAGHHKVIWYANNKASGVYFYKIISEDFTEVKKCVLLK